MPTKIKKVQPSRLEEIRDVLPPAGRGSDSGVEYVVMGEKYSHDDAGDALYLVVARTKTVCIEYISKLMSEHEMVAAALSHIATMEDHLTNGGLK